MRVRVLYYTQKDFRFTLSWYGAPQTVVDVLMNVAGGTCDQLVGLRR